MKSLHIFALVILFALPACLDSIVGTQCATGYSRCGGKCVPTGSCSIPDAGTDADATEVSPWDGSRSDDGATGETFAAVDQQPATDVEEDAEANQQEAGEPSDAGARVDNAGMEQADGSEPLPDAEVVSLIDAESVDADLDGPENPASEIDAPALALDAAEDAPVDAGASDLPPVDTNVALDLGDDMTTDATDDAFATGDATDDLPQTDLLPCVGCEDGGDASDDETSPLLADGGTDDGANGDDALWASPDANEPDASSEEVGPLVCADPLTKCNEQCVYMLSDPENCGGCNNMCTSGVCITGGCLICAAEESVCGLECINTASNPDNCGTCGVPCASGLCSNSHCEASGTGRAIVIGHDYLKNRTAMNRILGNAVFLWPVNPVRLLTYKGAANTTAIAGADQAISQVAAATGRLVQQTDLGTGDLATQLNTADVFLIYGQEGATDATLTQLGVDWTTALAPFTTRGGTIIVLDGYYAGNTGTVQILSHAGLFNIQRNVSTTNLVCTVVARGDAVANGLLRTYRCEQNSVSFTTTETGATITSVVESGTPAASVVIHKIF